jgi:hypothetical protein
MNFEGLLLTRGQQNNFADAALATGTDPNAPNKRLRRFQFERAAPDVGYGLLRARASAGPTSLSFRSAGTCDNLSRNQSQGRVRISVLVDNRCVSR